MATTWEQPATILSQFNFSYNAPDSGHPLTYPNGQIATLESGLSAINFVPLNVNAEGLGLSGVQLNLQTAIFSSGKSRH